MFWYACFKDRDSKCCNPLQGSGKTLAFGLPILQLVLNDLAAQADALQPDTAEAASDAAPSSHAEERNGAEGDANGRPSQKGRKGGGLLRALILAPTRELAMQVSNSGPTHCTPI